MARFLCRTLGCLALSLPMVLAVAADAAPPQCADRSRTNCQCRNCRDRDPCRHYSAFIREMRCTCRDYVAPAGTSLHAMMQRQIANGTASRIVLYHYDFFPRDARLNRRGLRQLSKISRMMAGSTAPLIIQPTPGTPELDELRRKLVAAQSANLPVPIPLERIIVAPRPTHGLDGIDAEIIHGIMLSGSAGSAGASGSSGSAGLGQAPTAQ